MARTHRIFGKLFEPYGFEHTAMSNIRKGELVEPWNAERLGLDPKSPADLKLLHDEVEDEFRRWQKVHNSNVEYVSIDMAEVDDGAYVLQAFLTNNGENALNALEQGYVWDRDAKAISLPASVAYYEDKVNRGILGEKTWGPITNFARKHEEFRPLRARVVYLRMQGDMTKGAIRPPVAA